MLPTVEPMTLVVGGVAPPHRVVGRENEEREALAALSGGGAVFVGDRRHGKTSLARRVLATAASQGDLTVMVSAASSRMQTIHSQ